MHRTCYRAVPDGWAYPAWFILEDDHRESIIYQGRTPQGCFVLTPGVSNFQVGVRVFSPSLPLPAVSSKERDVFFFFFLLSSLSLFLLDFPIRSNSAGRRGWISLNVPPRCLSRRVSSRRRNWSPFHLQFKSHSKKRVSQLLNPRRFYWTRQGKTMERK